MFVEILSNVSAGVTALGLADQGDSTKPEDYSDKFSLKDKEILISLLEEYGEKLFNICEKISDFQFCNNLVIILSLFTGGILFILINQLFPAIFRQIISFILLVFSTFIIYFFWQNRIRVRRLRYQARRIATRLEKVVRLGYQIQENMGFNAITKIELDLRLADAESALEYYHVLVNQEQKLTDFDSFKTEVKNTP